MLTVQFCFQWYHNPVTGKSEGHLRDGWEGYLQSALTAATPMIRAGAILAVFLGDEVCCAQGVPGANVSSVASAVRSKLDSIQSRTMQTPVSSSHDHSCDSTLHVISEELEKYRYFSEMAWGDHMFRFCSERWS